MAYDAKTTGEHKMILEPRADQGYDLFIYCDEARGTQLNEALARDQRKINCLHCGAVVDLYQTRVIEIRRRRGVTRV